jgi:hypothetical protein
MIIITPPPLYPSSSWEAGWQEQGMTNAKESGAVDVGLLRALDLHLGRWRGDDAIGEGQIE